jgi:hypothetical protein
MENTEGAPGDLLRIEKLILPFAENFELFPVAFAVFGHVSLLTAIAILSAAREGAVAAMAILAFLVAGTLWLAVRESKRRGRPAGITLILTLTWIGAAICAWAADHSGAF